MGDHAGAFGIDCRVSPTALRPEGFVGKMILYAEEAFVCPEITLPPFEAGRLPEIADVPASGTAFRPGDPVLTVLAGGASLEDCQRVLDDRIQGWRRRL
jgi:predicted ATP-grasp superfamily ATP-dependent carboligase